MDCMRQYYSRHVQTLREAHANILDYWHELDADFTLVSSGLAGAPLPPYRKLQPRVKESCLKSEGQYDQVFQQLPPSDRNRIQQLEASWPSAGAQDIQASKERCIQPEDATTLRLTYAAGIRSLELLYLFSLGVSKQAGCQRKVAWNIKRPFRLWKKTIEGYPEDFSRSDFRNVSDVYRTSVVVDEMEQIEQMVDTLKAFGRDAQNRSAALESLGLDLASTKAHFVVERIKNRFVAPCIGGYRDVIVNLRINGYVTELQLHLRQFLDVGRDSGRMLYKWYRSIAREVALYEGERSAEKKMHGSGTYFPLYGGRYDGQFQNGRRHGQGRFYYPNGDRYEGDFEDDKKSGKGTYFYAAGDRYKGSFADDKMDGFGTFYCNTGECFVGEYSEGKRHGKGTYYYRTGTCLQGEWWRNKHVTVVSV